MKPSLGAYAIDFQYLLLNEKTYSKEQLPTIRNIVSTLFLAKGITTSPCWSKSCSICMTRKPISKPSRSF
jgi:hypothetical protein